MATPDAPARENLIMMPEYTMWIVYPLMVISLGIMVWGFWERIKVYRRGRKAGDLPDWKTGLKDWVSLVLFQSRTRAKKYAGPMHSAIFYGFLALFIGTILVAIDLDIMETMFGAKLLKGSFYLWYELVLDIFGLAFMIGLLAAAWRRTFIRPVSLHTRPTDRYALWVLGIIGFTGFLIEGLRLHLRPVAWAEWSRIGATFADGYAALGTPTGATGEHLYIGIWWFHTLLVFAFIALIPFTKLTHIFTSMANSATRTQRPAPGRLSKPFDLMSMVEKGEFEFEMGADKPEDFSWKQLLMTDSCTNCSRCEDVCPATAAGRPLSPRVLVQDINHAAFIGSKAPPAFGDRASEGPGAMGEEAWLDYHTECRKDNGDGEPVGHAPILGNVVQEDTIWACTTCRACEEACPVVIEHVGLIMDMRRKLTLDGRVKKHQRQMIESVASAKNPWAVPASERMAWTKGLESIGVKVHEISEFGSAKDLDVVYWVGCAGASDPRNQRIVRAMSKILDHAGLKWAVLGKEESCTGDPVRRLGEEGRFQELAFENIAKFDAYEIKNVLTTCPHCFNTLKNEYPDFGWKDAKVWHHTEYIDKLMQEGKVVPSKASPIDSVAYHDSCYIGRHNGIYDQPRNTLRRLPGLKMLEVEGACAEKGRCCGAGGANMWYEVDEKDRMSNIRLRELKGTGAAGVASNCPFCMVMFEDAKSNVEADQMSLNDIAELVAATLPDKGDDTSGALKATPGTGDDAEEKEAIEALPTNA